MSRKLELVEMRNVLRMGDVNYQREVLGEFTHIPDEWLPAFQGFSVVFHEIPKDCVYCPFSMVCLRAKTLITRDEVIRDTFGARVGRVESNECYRNDIIWHVCLRCWAVAFRFVGSDVLRVCTLLREGHFSRMKTDKDLARTGANYVAAGRVSSALFGKVANFASGEPTGKHLELLHDIPWSCGSKTDQRKDGPPAGTRREHRWQVAFDPPHPYTMKAHREIRQHSIYHGHPRDESLMDCRNTIREHMAIIPPRALALERDSDDDDGR